MNLTARSDKVDGCAERWGESVFQETRIQSQRWELKWDALRLLTRLTNKTKPEIIEVSLLENCKHLSKFSHSVFTSEEGLLICFHKYFRSGEGFIFFLFFFSLQMEVAGKHYVSHFPNGDDSVPLEKRGNMFKQFSSPESFPLTPFRQGVNHA